MSCCICIITLTRTYMYERACVHVFVLTWRISEFKLYQIVTLIFSRTHTHARTHAACTYACMHVHKASLHAACTCAHLCTYRLERPHTRTHARTHAHAKQITCHYFAIVHIEHQWVYCVVSPGGTVRLLSRLVILIRVIALRSMPKLSA